MNLMNYSRFIGAIEVSTGTLMQIDIGFSPLIRTWKCFHFEESSTGSTYVFYGARANKFVVATFSSQQLVRQNFRARCIQFSVAK